MNPSHDKLLTRKAIAVLDEFLSFRRQSIALMRKQWKDVSGVELPTYDPPRPNRMSTRIVFCRDGVIILWFEELRQWPQIETYIVHESAEAVGAKLSLPAADGSERSLPFCLGVGASVEGCAWAPEPGGPIEFPYFTIRMFADGDPRLTHPVEGALLDLRLSALGVAATRRNERNGKGDAQVSGADALKVFERLILQFEELLEDARYEEKVQVFLASNPELLRLGAEVIPKQKLGEDFVTDFVLKESTAHGVTYTLVEIEQASKRLFTMQGNPSAALTQATRQTLDWESWLEGNQGYLRGRLADFESPRFLVVIGRDRDMTADDRKRLRAMNRRSSNTRTVTYDDLIADARSILGSLRKLIPGAIDNR